MAEFDKLISRIDLLLDRVEKIIPGSDRLETEAGFSAYRWTPQGLEGITVVDEVDKDELLHLERQKNLLFRNTALFLDGKAANNALLWGARGTGKSSLIKAQLSEFKDQGLCIIEVPKSATGELFEIATIVGGKAVKVGDGIVAQHRGEGLGVNTVVGCQRTASGELTGIGEVGESRRRGGTVQPQQDRRGE